MPTRSPPSSALWGSSGPMWRACRSAAVGIHLAARHLARVRSLSLHSGWHASDAYLNIVVEQWRTLASTLPTVADVVIQGIFPWCFTPEMYVERPEFVDTLVSFVRGRPVQPVDAFLAQTDAVLAHDTSAPLGEVDVPTLSRSDRATLPAPRASHSRSRTGSPIASSWFSTTCRTLGCTRTPRHSTAQRSTSCCASARDAATVTHQFAPTWISTRPYGVGRGPPPPHGSADTRPTAYSVAATKCSMIRSAYHSGQGVPGLAAAYSLSSATSSHVSSLRTGIISRICGSSERLISQSASRRPNQDRRHQLRDRRCGASRRLHEGARLCVSTCRCSSH